MRKEYQMRRRPNYNNPGASLDEVREDWKRAYIATANALEATQTIRFGHTDDPGIQKYALMAQANLNHALGNVSHVCAKGISIDGEEDGNGRQ